MPTPTDTLPVYYFTHGGHVVEAAANKTPPKDIKLVCREGSPWVSLSEWQDERARPVKKQPLSSEPRP